MRIWTVTIGTVDNFMHQEVEADHLQIEEGGLAFFYGIAGYADNLVRAYAPGTWFGVARKVIE